MSDTPNTSDTSSIPNHLWTVIPSSALRITGQDRVDFVQGQMTNDLRGLTAPAMCAANFLNVRGQIEHFGYFYRRTDDIYVHLAEGEASKVVQRFKKYIIFDQVEIEDLSDKLCTVHLWNEELATPFGWQKDGDVQQDVQQHEWQGCTLLMGRVRRQATAGVDVHVLREHLETFQEALQNGQSGQNQQVNQASIEELHRARVKSGLPDVFWDRWQGILPQEVGLDITGPLPAISYRKGCYVGQEIMARLEARGNTRYQLATLESLESLESTDLQDKKEVNSPAAELPAYAEVYAGGKKVGRLGWSAGTMALARLRKDVTADTELECRPQNPQPTQKQAEKQAENSVNSAVMARLARSSCS